MILPRIAGTPCLQGRPAKYALIKEQSAFHRVKKLCQVLNVSSSAYYAWLKGFGSPRQQEDRLLAQTLRDEFAASRQTYGVLRLQNALRKQGKHHGKARIKRLMQQEGLKPKAARRFKVTTDSRHSKPVAENRLGRQFNSIAASPGLLILPIFTPMKDGFI